MHIMQEFSIGPKQIDALYHYAKFQFECGNYSAAAEFLYHYRTLSTDNERNMSALWGKLAAEILMQNWCAVAAGGPLDLPACAARRTVELMS